MKYRLSQFHVERDLDREKVLFDKTDLQNQNYAFLHDEVSRGYKIDEKYVSSGLKIFRPDNYITKETSHTFLYLKIIENAKETHCMHSSFKAIVEHTITIDVKKCFYRYIRGWGKGDCSTMKSNWIDIIHPSFGFRIKKKIIKVVQKIN